MLERNEDYLKYMALLTFLLRRKYKKIEIKLTLIA